LKKILPYCFLLVCSTLVGQRCYVSNEFYNQQLSDELEVFTKNFTQQPYARSRSIIEIPVVVHVVWNTEEQNISDEQIHSQIEALNRDFQLLNEDTALVDSTFKAIIGNADISFSLASLDEEGQPTTGITRTETEFENIALPPVATTSPVYYTDQGGKDAWDTKRYLNIWVAEMPLGGPIGYASRPGQRIPEEDGVIVDYRHFGTLGTVKTPYHLGRTATHEIGHYFNLLHIHGDDSEDCMEDDGVEDTPFQTNNYQDCQEESISTCDSQDLTVNYMNWVSDNCMVMFTKGQVDRMKVAIMESRITLLDPLISTTQVLTEQSSIRIFPNPAHQQMYISYPGIKQMIPFQLINLQGRIVINGNLVKEKTTVNISDLPRGIYWVVIPSLQGVVSRKLLLH